jgi:LmbE family N-acetylglucosaminyl deacetylase
MNLTSPDDLKQLGTILVVGAHPDDETFIAGGVLAAAVANGQRIVCVTATRGEQGVQDESRWPAARLADIRTAESAAAFKALGLSEHIWLEYNDGACDQADEQKAIKQLQAIIADVHPDSIFTFGPDGLTGHQDHCAVSRWTMAANGGDAALYYVVHDPEHYEHALRAHDTKFNMYFNTPQPPLKPAAECAIAFRLTPEYLQKKRAAFDAMPSQYEIMLKGVTEDEFASLFGLECFVQA